MIFFFRWAERADHLVDHGWIAVRTPLLKRVIKREEQAVCLSIPRHASPRQLFDLLWTNEIRAHILETTLDQLQSSTAMTIRPEEVSKYWGMVCIFAVYGGRSIRQFFATGDHLIQYPGRQHSLGRSRFLFIGNHLYYSIPTIHQLLQASFSRHLLPGTHVCVDEIRVKCKNRSCPDLKFNTSKADRWAMEFISLHDLSGYLLAFTPPHCTETPFEALISLSRQISSTGRVHHVVADTRFSNVKQAKALLRMGLRCTLACQKDRPQYLFQQGLGRDIAQGRTEVASKGELVAATTKSNKAVNIISTNFTLSEQAQASAKERRALLTLYDETKRPADHFQQLYAAFHFDHRHQRWEANLLTAWFEYAVTNAYIIHKLMSSSPLTHEKFVEDLGISLLSAPHQ